MSAFKAALGVNFANIKFISAHCSILVGVRATEESITKFLWGCDLRTLTGLAPMSDIVECLKFSLKLVNFSQKLCKNVTKGSFSSVTIVHKKI